MLVFMPKLLQAVVVSLSQSSVHNI